MSLMADINSKARHLGIPLNVHVDITYRCNERCQHCYLDHEDAGEMTTEEIKAVLRQLADAGTFFLTISGGEPLLRQDCLEILGYARKLSFNVKLKTNALLIGELQAGQLCELGIEQVQISVYSHRATVHDSITKIRGSLLRTLDGIRRLKSRGVRVTIANVLMKDNLQDYAGVRSLARELGVHCTLDPTITPKMDGNTDILAMRVSGNELVPVFHDSAFVEDVDKFCEPPGPIDDEILDGIPCSAGHTSCYISPYGDVYPCVQFPLTCGNLRQQTFSEIWRESPQLQEVRSIRARDLHTCSGCAHLGTCSRCPGLAYMEGDMRGPSSADCDKSYVRTGIPSADMFRRSKVVDAKASDRLVQISV
jgi:AdoMet-dependent heme synthase